MTELLITDALWLVYHEPVDFFGARWCRQAAKVVVELGIRFKTKEEFLIKVEVVHFNLVFGLSELINAKGFKKMVLLFAACCLIKEDSEHEKLVVLAFVDKVHFYVTVLRVKSVLGRGMEMELLHHVVFDDCCQWTVVVGNAMLKVKLNRLVVR